MSGDLTASTLLTLGAGVSAVLGTSGHVQAGNLFDGDAFSFIIPTGYQLDQLATAFSSITYLGAPVTG